MILNTLIWLDFRFYFTNKERLYSFLTENSQTCDRAINYKFPNFSIYKAQMIGLRNQIVVPSLIWSVHI